MRHVTKTDARAFGRLAIPAAALAALLIAVGVMAFVRDTSAAADQITISSSADGGNVAVGSSFTVTLAVTASTTPYKSVQWEIAYPSNVSFVSATYTCSQFPSETESAPTEDNSGTGISGLPGQTVLGGGAHCASLSSSFTGTNQLGTFVTVTLQCNAAGDAQVILVNNSTTDPAGDQFFGTTLGDRNANNIPTDLQPQRTTQFGTEAAINPTCGTAVTATNTPPAATATNTLAPTATNTPIPTSTNTRTASDQHDRAHGDQCNGTDSDEHRGSDFDQHGGRYEHDGADSDEYNRADRDEYCGANGDKHSSGNVD